jgi:hypothetical protein
MMTLKPFENETDSLGIDDMTIENRLDSIALYGSMQITRDAAGLKLAREMKDLLDRIVATLEREDLPDHISIKPSDSVKNPF